MVGHAQPDGAQAPFFAVDAGDAISDGPRRTVRALVEHPLLDATWSRYEGGERGPDLHVHRRHVDAFVVVEGELRFRIGPDGQPVNAPAGTFVLVPPNVVHGFDNDSPARARWLNFHAPSTGFIASLRGLQDGFDNEPPPADGGRSAGDVVICAPGDGATVLARTPELTVTEHTLAPGGRPLTADGETVQAFFVLAGEAELAFGADNHVIGAGTWASFGAGEGFSVGAARAGPALLLAVRAPGAEGRFRG